MITKKKERIELISNLMYDAYHKIIPKLFTIGKDDFKIHDIAIYFEYNEDMYNEIMNKNIKSVLGEYRPASLYINICLEGIIKYAYDLISTANDVDTIFDIEIVARTKMVTTLIHELFHYNQKIDYSKKDMGSRKIKAEAMVRQKELEFQIIHYSDLIHYLGCDPYFLLLTIDTEYNNISDIKLHMDEVLRTSVEKIYPEIGFIPYEYTDSCNFLAEYIFGTYYERSFLSEDGIYDSGYCVLKTEEEIYNYTLKFINEYEKARTVKMEFDIDLSKIFTDIKKPRTSGYVVLKDNGKDLDEIKSVERLFNIIIEKIYKRHKMNLNQLKKLGANSIYRIIQPEKPMVKAGEYISTFYAITYKTEYDVMLIEMEEIKMAI